MIIEWLDTKIRSFFKSKDQEALEKQDIQVQKDLEYAREQYRAYLAMLDRAYKYGVKDGSEAFNLYYPMSVDTNSPDFPEVLPNETLSEYKKRNPNNSIVAYAVSKYMDKS